jgi:hypothetical protein
LSPRRQAAFSWVISRRSSSESGPEEISDKTHPVSDHKYNIYYLSQVESHNMSYILIINNQQWNIFHELQVLSSSNCWCLSSKACLLTCLLTHLISTIYNIQYIIYNI